jgi:bacterioferritin-associated ferredoxin
MVVGTKQKVPFGTKKWHQFRQRSTVSARPDEWLANKNDSHYHGTMIVCICHRVSDRDIARASAVGGSFEDLQVDLGVGTSCGACLDCARATHRHHAAPASAACPELCCGMVHIARASLSVEAAA